ncbi:hypothetical protein Tsubulata_012438 [Turnera subulata]|uniref:RNA polymerase I-specific transcription initiation factor RRN3 n=1 Tax=Turnera subulata TaxID=218843 RepID=A0A9Q0GK62_9ROSI|nr:hypothetical protein Tsubulata_012438 [Turnera subulata]
MGEEEDYEMMEGEVSYSDSDLVSHFREVLQSVVDPTSAAYDNYEQLLVVLRPSHLGPDEVALLVTSLKALFGAVTCIDHKRHHRLVNLLFGINVWRHGTDVIDAFLDLIVHMASTDTIYVDECLKLLVESFTPPKNLVDTLNQPRGLARKEQVLTRVHSALQYLVIYVPMAALKLPSVVVCKVPPLSRKDGVTGHLKFCTELYVKNMLMLDSGPLREFAGKEILSAVMDLLIELDAAIAWNDIVRVDSCKGIFEMEGENDEAASDDDEDNDDNEIPRTLSQKTLGENATAQLLDSLMVQIFEHLESCARDNRLDQVFETLLGSFKQNVLSLFKPKFAQFVLFYACSMDPGGCGVRFAEELALKFVDDNATLTRMNAVVFLASYLARGKFLEASFVVKMLKRLVEWCCEFCKTQRGSIQVFYHACQAIMYVLCFHMRSIMDDPELKRQLLLMPIELILKHELEPLRVCHADIVKEFLEQAKVVRQLTASQRFMFEDLSEDSGLSSDYQGQKRLDSFFPFDPCLLEKCDRGFIQPTYLYWKYVRRTYHSNEEDSSDEDSEEEFFEEVAARIVDEQDLGECDDAMNKMSISPMPMPSRLRPPSTSPPESP